MARSTSRPETDVVTSAFQATASGARSRRWLVTFVVLPALVGWAGLWWMGTAPAGRYFQHSTLASDQSTAPLVLVGWVVMIAAMMLPTTAPLLAVFRRVVEARPDTDRLVAALVGGYLAIWTLVGGVAIVGDTVLHVVFRAAGSNESSDPWIAAGVLALAGVYQFTRLKKRCVTACRSPFTFVSRHWRGNDPRWDAFRLGVAHGWFCVGCCWTLMLTMFAVGMGNLGWMLLLATVMAVEKNVARASWLGPVVGVALLVGAVVVPLRS